MTGSNIDMYQGLWSLYQECIRVYPDQDNPLQVNSLQKFWLGGPDPLDYISMYINPGNPATSVPPHWHYVSFGLSDLHGDGRVHPIKSKSQVDTKSGFGFELTFRIKRDEAQDDPPLWPANLMQALAKYIFRSGNPLLPGDHVSWHQSLNGQGSNIMHMLIATDSEFNIVNTPFGNVQFVQIIGVTADELEAIQHWNGTSFVGLMKQLPECGGEHLVTDMKRQMSVFQIDSSLRGEVIKGVDRDGSNLSGVTAECSWRNDAWKFYDDLNMHYLTPKYRTLNISLRKQQGYNSACSNMPKEFEDTAGATLLPDLREECKILQHLSPNLVSNVEEDCRGLLEDNITLFTPTAEDFDDRGEKSNAGVVLEHENSTIQLEGIFNDLRMSCGDSDLSSDDVKQDVEIIGEICYFDNIHITLNLEAGLLIPLALKGRVRHGRHFTFKSGTDDFTITIVTPNIQGAYATVEHPFASHGAWLHILLEDALVQAILYDFDVFLHSEAEAIPKTFLWPEFHFAITVNSL